MTPANTADATGRLRFKPPCEIGLSRKSPTVAPNGRVRMKLQRAGDPQARRR